MDSLRVENLRSLSDTGYIELKPITLLLGQNSSGKSTFLRCFPLFRQSIEARTTGPILWYGRFVDFGSFEEAVRREGVANSISFHFRFSIDYQNIPTRRRSYRNIDRLSTKSFPVDISLKIVGDNKQLGSRVEECIFRFADHMITLAFASEGKVEKLLINEADFSLLATRFHGNFQRMGLIPIVSEPIYEPAEVGVAVVGRRKTFYDALINEIKGLVHKNTKNETVSELAGSLVIGTAKDMLRIMKETPYATETWRERVSSWTENTPDFLNLKNIVIASYLRELLVTADEYINSFVAISRYMAPLRATAERYYRLQNLAVDDVDFQGQNLAMFLRNLSNAEFKGFQRWTESNFGFIPELNSSSGHISLMLKERGSENVFNLTDKGFGLSQILPILTQLWVIVYIRGRRYGPDHRGVLLDSPRMVIFAVEQPELHLHPYLQAQLVDAFLAIIKAARQKNVDLRIVIETHSETIVNRFGHKIAEKEVEASDVNIVLFEKESPDSPTIIQHSGYDNEGFLKNWPFGFFEPSES